MRSTTGMGNLAGPCSAGILGSGAIFTMCECGQRLKPIRRERIVLIHGLPIEVVSLAEPRIGGMPRGGTAEGRLTSRRERAEHNKAPKAIIILIIILFHDNGAMRELGHEVERSRILKGAE